MNTRASNTPAASTPATNPTSLESVLRALETGGPSSHWKIDARALLPAGVAAASVVVSAATHDSRRVRAGSVFVAVTGSLTDGHRYLDDAIQQGASVVVVEREDAVAAAMHAGVAAVVVADTRRALGPVAAAVYGQPATRLQCIGITGTNGKTTTAHFLHKILERAGRPTELIGTLTQARTTPEATELQERLANAERSGATHAVMEVTSHALELHRVDGMRFAVACFTNLSQDHLDFHGSMEAYFRAKADLFTARRADRAVVFGDDLYGRLLIDSASVPTVGFGMTDVTEMDLRPNGSDFVWNGRRMSIAMGGSFNVVNAVGAAVCAEALGIDTDAIVEGINRAGTVPGRFEPIDEGQAFSVIVDFAHTPDGLARVLAAARSTTSRRGRVLVVFGCGGDRDREKRSLMGEAAARLADVAIITNDNPRSEDPREIASEILEGALGTAAIDIELDRAVAIGRILGLASDGDVVIIAGKGHETGQDLGGVVTPFDDRSVARAWLRGQR